MIGVGDLREFGIVVDDPMTTEHVDEIVRYLVQSTSVVHRSHVSRRDSEVAYYDQAIRDGWTVFAHRTVDVVTAPWWLERAISYRAAAGEYFGGPARLYSLNAFWTLPSAVPYVDTQGWHRDDGDGPDQFTVFMIGTDVVDAGGMHEYQMGTHRAPYPSVVEYESSVPDNGTVEYVSGPRGTIVVEDTHGLHRANPYLTAPRLVLWARWTTAGTIPRSYVADRISPVSRQVLGDRYPSDPEVQRAIDLVVA